MEYFIAYLFIWFIIVVFNDSYFFFLFSVSFFPFWNYIRNIVIQYQRSDKLKRCLSPSLKQTKKPQ